MSSTRSDQAIARLAELTPRQIVAELDRHIIGQQDAKRAVAVALRNRWRRQHTPDALRADIAPNNIILIGPTGVGKTEIARRVAKLAGAPFVKVEASKFTEVGYVGRDVESMVRDLVDNAIDLVREERERDVEDLAYERVDERLLDLLVPTSSAIPARDIPDDTEPPAHGFTQSPIALSNALGTPYTPQPSGESMSAVLAPPHSSEKLRRTRERLRALLIDGNLDNREVEIETVARSTAMSELPSGSEAADALAEWLRDTLPKTKRKRQLKVKDARRILLDEELAKLIDDDDVAADAIERVEQMGIVFLDEIDKIASQRGPASGPEVSREGVQRDLLPIVEGSTVSTRYGNVRTDHVLFIAAGAFHLSKPSDLIPELQGRFPIRVELTPLTESEFVRVMTEPESSLVKQYSALVQTEGASLEFTGDGIAELARVATRVNQRIENIGARRLHTVMSALLEDVMFDLPNDDLETITVDAGMVRDRLRSLGEDEDLRRYML